jgi:hypothetical protein
MRTGHGREVARRFVCEMACVLLFPTRFSRKTKKHTKRFNVCRAVLVGGAASDRSHHTCDIRHPQFIVARRLPLPRWACSEEVINSVRSFPKQKRNKTVKKKRRKRDEKNAAHVWKDFSSLFAKTDPPSTFRPPPTADENEDRKPRIHRLVPFLRLRRLDSLLAPEATGAARRDETSLGTRGFVPAHGGGVSDVLVVTTTVRVFHGVHRHTTHLGPGSTSLRLVLVVVRASLEHGLVAPAATRDLSDGATASGRDGLLGTGGELDSGETGVGVVGDEDAVFAGRFGQHAAVTELGFDVADDGTFGHVPHG